MIQESNEATENKYGKRVSSLPGCLARWDTPAESLGNIQSVASRFIDSYRSRDITKSESI